MSGAKKRGVGASQPSNLVLGGKEKVLCVKGESFLAAKGETYVHTYVANCLLSKQYRFKNQKDH